ncbi:MAG TPA: alpha/beta hydrolase [Bryobacteraceae bacterium]|nr:alpha/beta hydrolase [Bryobacteraceae bacterium]
MSARLGLEGLASRVLIPALPLLLSGYLWGQSTNPVELLKQPAPPATGKIAYGADPLQFAEIRVPPGKGRFPVAILVHGGCWSARLKGLPEAVTSFELLRPISAALAEAGIASWNIEYRRLGNEGGGWPGTYRDLSRATDMLRNIAPRYHLDLGRTIVIGHSSGGQLAMWLAGRGRLPKKSPLYTDSPLPLQGVVDIDGPPDLETFRAFEQSMCGGPVITQFFGGTPAEFPERYREGSVTGLLPTGARQELFVRAKPTQIHELLDQYVAAAKKADDPVRLFTFKGDSHFDGINPKTPDWETVMASIRSLLHSP